jgi:hypothetical protein
MQYYVDYESEKKFSSVPKEWNVISAADGPTVAGIPDPRADVTIFPSGGNIIPELNSKGV